MGGTPLRGGVGGAKGVLVRLHDLVGPERPENVGVRSLLDCPRTGLSVNET